MKDSKPTGRPNQTKDRPSVAARGKNWKMPKAYKHNERCGPGDIHLSLTVPGVHYCGCCKGLFEPTNGNPLEYTDPRITNKRR